MTSQIHYMSFMMLQIENLFIYWLINIEDIKAPNYWLFVRGWKHQGIIIPILQIPQCIKYPTMHHVVTEMCTHVHISVTKKCIVGYRTGALWDLWCGSATVLSTHPCVFSCLWFNSLMRAARIYIYNHHMYVSAVKWFPKKIFIKENSI